MAKNKKTEKKSVVIDWVMPVAAVLLGSGLAILGYRSLIS